MHKHLPIIGVCYVVLPPQAGTAVSGDANVLRQTTLAMMRWPERSQALFGRKAEAISNLRALANECCEDGWDGNDARAIDVVALLNAEAFLRALPENVSLPEFAPEPDGSISFDWIRSRNRLFSLSVASSNRLAYAWLNGTDKGHGVEHFDGANVPSRVLEEIKSIGNNAHASIGIARND